MGLHFVLWMVAIALDQTHPPRFVHLASQSPSYLFRLNHSFIGQLGKIFEVVYSGHTFNIYKCAGVVPSEIRQFAEDVTLDHPIHCQSASARNSDAPSIQEQAFHLKNTGASYDSIEGEDLNVEPAWKNGFTGKGVTIAMIDTGFRYTHESFVIDPLSFNALGPEYKLNETGESVNHGTIDFSIAASRKMPNGFSGVAYESNSVAVAFSLRNTTLSMMLKLFDLDRKIQVHSHSFVLFGYVPDSEGSTEYILDDFYTPKLVAAVIDDLAKTNTIVTRASANSGESGQDANSGVFNSHPKLVMVGSSSNRGRATAYSNYGHNVLVNALGGGDEFLFSSPYIMAASAYSDKEYKAEFSGTSQAAPQVAAVIALMKQANSELIVEDIQTILALTAKINDPQSSMWLTNKAGFKYHPTQGFGRVNADKATKLSKTWPTLKGKLQTHQVKSTGPYKVNSTYQEMTWIEMPAFSTDDEIVHKLQLELDCNGALTIQGLRIVIESPSGTKREILTPYGDGFIYREILTKKRPAGHNFFLLIYDFFGEPVNGQWKIGFKSETYNPSFVLNAVYLTAPCFSKDVQLVSQNEEGANGKHDVTIDNFPGFKLECKEEPEMKTFEVGKSYHFSITTDITAEECSLFHMVLHDIETNEEMLVGRSMFNKEKVIEFDFTPDPLFFDNKSMMLGFIPAYTHYQHYQPIMIRNTKENFKFVTPPYSIFDKDSLGDISVTIDFTHFSKSINSHKYLNKVLISVTDIDTKEVLFVTSALPQGAIRFFIQYKSLNITLTQPVRAIVTISPIVPNESDECSTMVLPIILKDDSMETPGHFTLPFTSKCIDWINDDDDDGSPKKKRSYLAMAISFGILGSLLVIFLIVFTVMAYRRYVDSFKRKPTHEISLIDSP